MSRLPNGERLAMVERLLGDEPRTFAEMLSESGLPKYTLASTLHALKRLGRAAHVRRGVWASPSSPHAADAKDPSRLTRAERFWPKVHRTDREGCWEWSGSRDRKGYGKFGRGAGLRGWDKASRVAWELENGPIPEGLQVCHRCDNPPCVRPDHLFLGTTADNLRDMRNKGRAFYQTHPDEFRAKMRAVPRVPRPLKKPRECAHCLRLAMPTRRGLCGACSEYRRRRGSDRPLDGIRPARSDAIYGALRDPRRYET